MEFRKLGNTDIDVSLICLGTMTWGEQNTENDGFEQMDYAVAQGINFFDTAELYSVPPTPDSYGKTEIMIGNWIEKRKNRNKKYHRYGNSVYWTLCFIRSPQFRRKIYWSYIIVSGSIYVVSWNGHGEAN